MLVRVTSVPRPTTQRLVVDDRIGYVKQDGDALPKAFKLKVLTLEPGERITLRHSRASTAPVPGAARCATNTGIDICAPQRSIAAIDILHAVPGG
ncbi:hypothetical protein [Burkholderia sp. YIM B11467]